MDSHFFDFPLGDELELHEWNTTQVRMNAPTATTTVNTTNNNNNNNNNVNNNVNKPAAAKRQVRRGQAPTGPTTAGIVLS